MSSGFSARVLTRTFSNSLECIFLIIGVYYWSKIPHGKISKGKIITLNSAVMTFLISLSFLMRNSSAVPWIPLLMYKVFWQRNFKLILVTGISIAIPTVIASIAMDSWFYGKLTIVALNFLKFNVLSGGSELFGISPRFEYFS